MKLKLFMVDVETNAVVLAKDAKSAEEYVKSGEIPDYDLIHDAYYNAREIKDLKHLDEYWADELPHVDRSLRMDKQYEEETDLTCREFMEKFQEEIEKKRIKEEQDKLQLKFNI